MQRLVALLTAVLVVAPMATPAALADDPAANAEDGARTTDATSVEPADATDEPGARGSEAADDASTTAPRDDEAGVSDSAGGAHGDDATEVPQETDDGAEGTETEDGTGSEEASSEADEAHATIAATSAGFPIRSSVRAAGEPNPAVRVAGSGWGHGVGMSQYGSAAMARAGHGVNDIIAHYYPGLEPGSREESSTRPIRVGLRQNQASTWVRAVTGPIRWDACPPTLGGPTPDAQCERLQFHADSGQTGNVSQPAGATWHVCPISNGNQRVQDRACGQSGFRTIASTAQPVLRVQLGNGADAAGNREIVAPGYRPETRLRRGAHDIIRPGTGQSLTTVQNVPSVEQYLYGLAESILSWPAAALQAQAVTGRTYALRTLIDRPTCRCDILASPSHQAYEGFGPESVGAWRQAVDETRHRVLINRYQWQGQQRSELAETYYSSSHGGRSESLFDSWAYNMPDTEQNRARYAYLESVDDPWSVDEAPCASTPRHASCNPNRSWQVDVRNRDVANLLSAGWPGGAITTVEHLEIRDRTTGGTPATLRVRGRTSAGETVSFDYAGTSTYVAGAMFRRQLQTTGGASLRSSQIRSLSFGPFDDDDGHVHEYAIVWANHAGVANGLDATRFGPQQSLRRDQMATLLVNTFAIPPSSQDRFDDVDESNPHYAAINALAAAGVTTGVRNGRDFDPRGYVTRAQMASFLARAAGWDTSDTSTAFTDVPRGDVHRGAITAIERRGVTAGCDTAGTRYCPTRSVTRGQMASFLHRVVRAG
ncbi:S-layer homology domain-containing protein [Egicoccus sp. AB-alg2]|uniref:S-layer homology domain-containing protein n=1 Tax=Egicoccus sp. AB-alg2 TaxID=3242693 RepID=UPI00359E64D8